jgi:hypothetical protein
MRNTYLTEAYSEFRGWRKPAYVIPIEALKIKAKAMADKLEGDRIIAAIKKSSPK